MICVPLFRYVVQLYDNRHKIDIVNIYAVMNKVYFVNLLLNIL